ncbi:MAG: hypothetical protein RLZZ165_1881, partial [Bacteroidota bacterium]
VVSTQGLILTNHHCGLSQIQSKSTVEHDYLRDGFWARSKDQELPSDRLTATFVVRIEDMTARVLEGTEGLDPSARAARIASNIASLEIAVEKAEPKHQAEIKPFFYGNEYYMIVSKTYRDVRLVGAPPSSVGKFGGDTDNWMWPRHTGDFSLFRIYADAQNEPADYSMDNRPYVPGHSLPVSLKGTQPGDFTMVYGFPGMTEQYLHSASVEFIAEEMNPRAIAMRDQSLAVIDATMAKSDRLRIAYAAKQARIANAWKKWIGETKGIERLHAVEKKRALERRFAETVAQDPGLRAQYGKVLQEIEATVQAGKRYQMARVLFIELYHMGVEALRFSSSFTDLAYHYEKLKAEGNLAQEITRMEATTMGFYQLYDPDADRQILAALYPLYIDGLAPELRPDLHASLSARYGNDWKRFADEAFANSVFTNEARLKTFLKRFGKKSPEVIQNDPIFKLQKSVLAAWNEKARPSLQELYAKQQDLMRVYVKGLMTVFPDKKYWPDANSTLRLTFGKVEGSEPADGVIYRPYCTMAGMLAKYVKGDREFDVPDRLVELARNHDFGPYADANGDLVLCFTASNHTTGGNSGSPVIDGSGNLIGLNFDRTWESTMSDLMYDPGQCRNIMVDIRYVLFIIDKYAGARNLIDEMKLVKG